jgi:hypothetical protein
MVAVVAEMVTVSHEGATTAEGHDLQAMSREFEVAGDLWAEQTRNIRTIRVVPPRVEFAAHCGAANVGIALEDSHLEARFRKIGAVGQTVVTRANDYGIVLVQGCLRDQK